MGAKEEEFRAHKSFLMTASPLFHQMFASPSEDSEAQIKILDITPATMTEICRYAYCDIVSLNRDNMIDILQASSKLQMKFLMEKAIDFVCKDGMNDQTVFKILEANSKQANMRINMRCFDYLERNHKTCFKADSFKSIPFSLLRDILQMSKVSKDVANEAVCFWSTFRNNEAEDLDELFGLITLKDDFIEEIGKTSEPDDDSKVPKKKRHRRYGRHGGNKAQ